LLTLGVGVGFMAGLLGVGGGMMMVPVMSWVLQQQGVEAGMALKMAIATSMATIVFTSLSSVLAHHRLGTVRWAIAARMAPGMMLGGLVGGGGAFAALKGQGLALIFAAFIGTMAVRMFNPQTAKPARELPAAWAQSGVGAAIGFASALLGAGGAFLSVPFMTRCNVPPRQAVGTSAALGLPIALSSTLGYVLGGWQLAPALPGAFGYLYVPGLVVVAGASMSLAPLGARTAGSLHTDQLQRLFAVLLLILAASMLLRALGT
jgi:uncharacterized membrane protein YfcA